MGPLSKDNHLGEQHQQPDVGKVQNSPVGGCRPIRARNRLVLAVKIEICKRRGLTVHCALCTVQDMACDFAKGQNKGGFVEKFWMNELGVKTPQKRMKTQIF